MFVAQDILETVFEDGKLVREYTFAEVRDNAELPIVVESRAKKVCYLNKKNSILNGNVDITVA